MKQRLWGFSTDSLVSKNVVLAANATPLSKQIERYDSWTFALISNTYFQGA